MININLEIDLHSFNGLLCDRGVIIWNSKVVVVCARFVLLELVSFWPTRR